MTPNICKAFIEIDLGEERVTNRIRVVHRLDAERSRANGVTLYVMDGNRKVLFDYTFTGLSNLCNPVAEFNLDKTGALVQSSHEGDGSIPVAE